MYETEKQIIYEAYTRHCDQHHNSDFEVCADPQCAAAVKLEDSLWDEVNRKSVWERKE